MMSPPGQAAALAGTRLPGNRVPQGTGVPAPSNPEVPEQGTGAESAASSCSIPTLAPVTFRNARGGNNRAEYHPFPRATIKEICKAHRIYGRDGPYFRGLLRADLSAEEVVPADLKYLFSCLLNPTEYILWVTAWKRLLQEALPGLLNHVNTRVDAQGIPLTLDHLAGEGQWAEATDQVVIPVQCLHVVRETALTAFFSMQTQGPAISYSKIRQDQSKLIVVGDCKHTPKEIEILPGTLDNNPGKFVLWLRCTHPPTFLPKGQTVAQIIPTWEHLEEDNIPTACPVHNITEVKPQVGCELQVGDEAINITGLLDTGADVTVIPAKHWPSRWALENVAGHVQGIGGMQLARQSKSVVQIKGPKGQLASLRPFVLDYREPLLGRDLMAQWGVTIDIPDPPQDFWAAVAEERPTHKLNWKTDAPVWVEQWPLSKQKLKALEELVEEQLAKGHIVETTSPWNSPVFVIRKPGKDKWRLLQDLRQINNVIEDMGSLQPGMPTPTMLPQNWKLAVIDIKDCFFHIPLHPDDAPRFAFSVPTVNREAPRKRYHWRVLPQGMKVSPIICQWYVASLLSPVRVAAEKAIIHHYMDDVLVCAPTDDVLSHALDLTINALVVAGFELQEDKVQRMLPWRYLGLEIGKRTIVPQKLEIKAKIQTLADVHQLCGALNWVRPWLGLTTEDLAPLFNLLKGGEELSSPRELTPEAKEALEKCLACVLFRPVEYKIFECKWTQLAGRVIAQNTALSQQDPRRVIGTDVLMGIGNFADLQRQVAFDPLVLDQCHRTGMAALVQTIEMAAPNEPFAAVVQGTHEPFLQFAERLTASIERQVEDLNARQTLLIHLARTNCNAKCRRIIEALPDDPFVLQMAQACAKVGATGYKMAAMATALQLAWTGLQSRQRKQGNAQASKKQGGKVQKGTTVICFCSRCGGPNHTSNAWQRTGCDETAAFGSTGPPQVHWTAVLTKDRPEKVCILSIPGATQSEIHLRRLLDTGADITILSLATWPLEWPLD
ncbi:hypothetical protein DUI87_03025 [Hirundo rustica rustica]|uniref:ribonuclease H n=1 Tax=Hirundo rustica rustica TaxID=333673 RepID=A0A3M0L973_HIRRU|nr:hypothetical protein DUI87_03025 [Hirundo rustica rustica]